MGNHGSLNTVAVTFDTPNMYSGKLSMAMTGEKSVIFTKAKNCIQK